MPAKIPLRSFLPRLMRPKRVLYLAAVATVIGLAAWANSAHTNTTLPSPTVSALAPAFQLAAGTLKLEGTAQAVDAATAANLLPLWQLLAQLESSSSAAPQEITVVVEEIRLNMTSAQLTAIDNMSLAQSETGNASPNAAATTSGTQSASAAAGPMLGGDMGPGGGMPMDGGGPMPSGGRQSASTSKSSSSTSTSAVSSVLEQVIELLQGKVQG